MKAYLRMFLAAVVVALFAMLGNPASTTAQPCGTITYVNTTGFNVTIGLWTAPAILPVGVPPGGRIIQPLPGPVNVMGVFGASGAAYPWAPNPFPPPPFWLSSVQLATAPPPNMCYNVFWDPATCTVTIVAFGPAPCVNP
ncbi:MAG: hypothetical protein JWQ98_716 [Chlorobi bacterium]|nr:hypothetical protein [Chlorobiota bacterium]